MGGVHNQVEMVMRGVEAMYYTNDISQMQRLLSIAADGRGSHCVSLLREASRRLYMFQIHREHMTDDRAQM